MTDFVLGFAFSGEQVVLINKTKPEWQKGKLNGLGGKIEVGEYPYEAMRREFREECGLDVANWTQYATMRSGRHVIHVFHADVVKTLSSPMFKQSDEGQVGLYRWRGVPDISFALPNLSWLIPLARMEAGVRADIFYPTDPLEKR